MTRGEPGSQQPVHTRIPILILQGENDPITPPRYSLGVAKALSNDRYFTFPGEGHGLIQQSCAMEIVAEFLAHPGENPKADCLANLKRAPFITR